ncbi:hypothetical protein GQ44DRAFT_622277 [Phaeosphaeriaceae sp. PMI808]|nr:hypothetical protein GQ44DRAFT_622277 [Phaeosphaeriaceae sp. PMI808]
MLRNLAITSSMTLRTTYVRSFSVSTARPVEGYPNNFSTNAKTKTDAYPDNKHAVNKAKEGDTHNIQEASAQAGMDSAHKNDTGGNATEGRDSAGAKAKAKKEFPEAPDPAIGMQDERGGQGG